MVIKKKTDNLTFEQKNDRLEQILERLDNAEVPMDQLASEAKEAGDLIVSMRKTLTDTKKELVEVFKEIENQKLEIKQEENAI